MKKTPALFLFAFMVISVIGATAMQTVPSDLPDLDDMKPPAGDMPGIIARYQVERESVLRMNGDIPSPERRAAVRGFYGQWIEALKGLDFEAMIQEDKVDYLLLKERLGYEIRRLDEEAAADAEAAPWVPGAQTICGLEESRRRMDKIDPQKTAALLAALSKEIQGSRAEIMGGPGPDPKAPAAPGKAAAPAAPAGPRPDKKTALRAAAAVDELREVLADWLGFFNGYDPMFTWWADAPGKALDKSLQDYASALREKFAGIRPTPPGGPGAGAPGPFGMPGGFRMPRWMRRAGGMFGGFFEGMSGARSGSSDDIVGEPIGREALMTELAHEMIPYTPEELVAIGEKEYAWCEAEMKKASRELGYGDDWLKALEHVKTLYVAPGEQPKLIHDLAWEAIRYLETNDLVTIPRLARDIWGMEMMSPERQLMTPFFTGGETISVSYPTNTMSHEAKMMSLRGNNPHFARATVFHELIPGHHLQGYMSQRYRPYRNAFGTAFYGEGWCLYWEMFLYSRDFPGTPENRIGALFWRMHRAARIIFSLKFHLGRMTPKECIDFLVNKVGHEPENATAEVRRSIVGGYGPLYQAAYMIGGLQIRALRAELVDTGKMTNRAFHDAILGENSLPIEMLRALMTDQKLTRDYTAKWKFYGPSPAGK